jgi:hypothetical protein
MLQESWVAVVELSNKACCGKSLDGQEFSYVHVHKDGSVTFGTERTFENGEVLTEFDRLCGEGSRVCANCIKKLGYRW